MTMPMTGFPLSMAISAMCSWFVFSCASGARSLDDKTQTERTTGVALARDAASCDAGADPGTVGVPLDDFSVRSASGESLTVCAALAASGRSTAIFQLAGVTCGPCKKLAQSIERALAANPGGDDVAHIIVMTDDLETSGFSAEDYDGFVRTNAPGATRMNDVRQRLWKGLRQALGHPELRTRPSLIVSAARAGRVIPDERHGEIVPAALAMAEAPSVAPQAVKQNH
jgi:hypothetical protein